MNLPNVTGTLSDSDKIGWNDKDQTVSKLLYQPSITDDFADLTAWTEYDSGANVNLAAGVVSINGSNAYGANGLVYTGGITRAEGYLELKCLFKNVASGIALTVAETATMATFAATARITTRESSASLQGYNATLNYSIIAKIAQDTWYTIRIYIGKSNDGATWKFWKSTIEGGAYTEETTVVCVDQFATTAYSDPFHFWIQRYSANANIEQFKEFRWYTGYDTGGEYIEFVHDAGAGNTWQNFDLTNLDVPASMDTTNLKFAYSYDDGTPSYSSWLTLANLQAEGEQVSTKRYIRLRTQSNSDGSTQAYGVKPDATDATDGISGGGIFVPRSRNHGV